MNKGKNGLSIVALVLGIAGCIFNCCASPASIGLIAFAMILTITSLVCAVIVLTNKNYKKVCAIISIVFCFISLIAFIGTVNMEKSIDEMNKQNEEYNNRTYVVSFDTDGGSEISPMTVSSNTYLTSVVAYKEGYEFKNWTLNGAVFNLEGYVNSRITSDVTLKANYIKRETKGLNTDNFSNPSNNSGSNNKPSSSGNSNPTTSPNNNTNVTYGYQQIYNEYSNKLKKAGPTSSISEMADILWEGTTKMAEYMYSAKGVEGQYATYESWVQKLTEVYMNEVR